MKRRDIILVCCLLAVIVLGMFTYTYLEKVQREPEVSVPNVVDVEGNKTTVTRIDAKHFYRDGVHTIVGEIMLPTACDLLTYESRVAESYPEQVTFVFDVINNSGDCTKALAPQRFLVEATASREANLTATMSGIPVELNLIEAAPNETPESFELFLKG